MIKTVLSGAAIIPDCESPKFFIELFKKDPSGLEDFLRLAIVQEKLIALEKGAADLKSVTTERSIK